MPWEYEWIKFVQGVDHPALRMFFKAITSLGSVYFFLTFLSISWVLGRRKFSLHFTLVLLFCVLINTLVKEVVARPRPSLAFFNEVGYSFPSGHSQIAVVFWGYLIYHLRQRWSSIAFPILIFLIGFSRVYLGVHYPTDVLAGWAIGAIWLLVYIRWTPPIENFSRTLQALFIVLFIAVAPLYHAEYYIPVLSGLTGLTIGNILAEKNLHFFRATTTQEIIARVAIAILGTFAIYLGIKYLVKSSEITRFVRYTIILVWMSFLAPKICCWNNPEERPAW